MPAMSPAAHPPLPAEFTRYNQLGLSWAMPVNITRALEYAKNSGVAGDYYEFGLYAGSSFHHAQQEAVRLGLGTMHFWGFDSFQGLPDVAQEDGIAKFPAGHYCCDLATVTALHDRFGVDWRRVHLIDGWYDDTLTETLASDRGMAKAAVVVVDCDMYASTLPVLRFITPLLQHGTVLIFDDWGFGGERKAFLEWLIAHREWWFKDIGNTDWADHSFITQQVEVKA
jgi:O-methyltransferase